MTEQTQFIFRFISMLLFYLIGDCKHKKVKGSHNSPRVAQGIPQVLGSQIFMTFGT